jgi:ADP-ribose pyrophosphatase YjhB (NUDIX family)
VGHAAGITGVAGRAFEFDEPTSQDGWYDEGAMSSSAGIEISAGAILVRRLDDAVQALLIRVRKEGFEIPKGHVEANETKEIAALRELCEETGLQSCPAIGPQIGVLEYSFERAGQSVTKRVHYFAACAPAGESVRFGDLPHRTRERRWITSSELAALPLVNEQLRPIIAHALHFVECGALRDEERAS